MRSSPAIRRARRLEIPVFSLYGEARLSAPERFHIEDIRSRSERYDWEIKSHSHRGLFQIIFLFDGKARVRLDHVASEAAAPCAIIVPSGTVHAFSFQPHAHGYVLTVAESEFVARSGGAPTAPAAQTLAPGVVDLSGVPGEVSRMVHLLAEIQTEFRAQAAGVATALEGLVGALFVLVGRRSAAGHDADPRNRRRSEAFARFRSLVEAHFTEHRPVGFYAQALHMTESRLNRLCRATVGKSALEIVNDRLLLEAQRKLTHIAAPVSLLAYELGFADPAYFWRFFKKHAGLTPSQFRARQH